MKKYSVFLILMCLLMIMTGCGNTPGSANADTESTPTNTGGFTETNDTTDALLDAGHGESAGSSESQSKPSDTEEEPDMLKIEILVGNQTFTAALYDNEAAGALMEMLPLTLNMSELNGNEKYYYLDKSLPTNASRPSGIKAGDMMLYGDSCLVLFYESFSTSYSYTPIGHIDDPAGLAGALGSGSVQVTFRKG